MPTTADPTTADPTTADPTTADPKTADPKTADPTTADPSARRRWNFAYGANINEHKLRIVRRIQPHDSRQCRLRGWRLAFNHNGAMGNLVRDPAGVCHGVAHLLDDTQFAKLCEMESDYDPVDVMIEPYTAVEVPHLAAVAFVSKASHEIAEGLPPPTRYVNLLRDGARHWNLVPEHIAWLDGVVTADSTRGAAYSAHVHSGERIAATWKHGRGGKGGSRGDSRAGGKGAASNGKDGGVASLPTSDRGASADAGHGGRGDGRGRCAGRGGRGGNRRDAGVRDAAATAPSTDVLTAASCGRGDAGALGAPREAEVPWEVMYWPGFPGRAEFVRLMLAEVGAPWVEPLARGGQVQQYFFGKERGRLWNGRSPVLAPPVLRRGSFQLCQTAAILRYLGKLCTLPLHLLVEHKQP